MKIWSSLATKVSVPRDVTNRQSPKGILVHSTGSGIVESAHTVGADPLEFAISFYTNKKNNFAHYLIGHKGEIVQIAADTEKAWQAAWKPWEEQAYKDRTWVRKWAKDYADNVVSVDIDFYGHWQNRWWFVNEFRAEALNSPIDLVTIVSGKTSSPNATYIGIELLDAKPFHKEQYDALAKLTIDLGLRWAIPITGNLPGQAFLPNPWLCGHEDLCPARRYKKVKGSLVGVGWDPGEHFNWRTLRERIEYWSSRDLSEWYLS